MAQTLPVLTGGLDLSVAWSSSCATAGFHLVVGSAVEVALGSSRCSAPGSRRARSTVPSCLRRLQPIITTLATGAIFYGVALLLRPVPGGAVDEDLAIS